MPRTAFVTGANGFVGLNLVQALLAQGWRVLALHRAASDIKYLQRMATERVAGDVTDADAVLRAMPEGLDAVFHVAGDTNLWSRNNAAQDRVNIDGTRNVVHAALARIGSGDSQPGRDPGAVRHAQLRAPGDAAGRGQASGRAHRRAALLPRARSGARACRGVRSRPQGRELPARRTDASFVELVQAIGAALGKPAPARPTPGWLLYLLGAFGALGGTLRGKQPTLTPEMARQATRELSCDCAKAMRELGYRAVPLREMVADCVAWMVAEGLLPGVQSAPRNKH